MRTAGTRALALSAYRKHLEVHRNFDHYTGAVTLHGLARLATAAPDEQLIQETRSKFLPHVRGERKFPCNFPNYQCGGNGTAWLLWKGMLPEAAEIGCCATRCLVKMRCWLRSG